MNTLELLLKQIPDWVKVTRKEGLSAQVLGSPPKASGLPAGDFKLAIHLLTSGGVSVAEIKGGTQLPKFCPERHINPGGSYCISYGSTEPLSDDFAADSWWEHLRMFLIHQVYAGRHGVWPLEGGLCHGDAALIQEKMEELADPLGWKDEILEGIFRNKGWLADALPRASRRLNRLLNARTPCPRGCTIQKDLPRKKNCRSISTAVGGTRDFMPVLRAECPNRASLEKIALLEHKRRKLEQGFMTDIKKEGYVCCRTMKNCPLSS